MAQATTGQMPDSAITLDSAPPPRRLTELDGIRGWASLSVVAFHIFWETFGVLQPGFRNPFTFFFLNGQIAVAIFFILSGEALSAGYFAGKGERAVAELAVKRYPRLTIPILASSLVIYLLMKLQAVNIEAAADIVHRPDWLGIFLAKTPDTFSYMLRYSLFDVYTGQPAWLRLNPFLWTMRFEIIGSMIVFVILIFLSRIRGAWILIVAAAIALSLQQDEAGYYSCFLVGVCFAKLRVEGLFDTARRNSLVQWLSWIAIVALFGISALIPLGHLAVGTNPALFAAPLLLAIFANASLSSFFSSRPLRFLGAISFPLYLMQFPVFAGFMTGAILRAYAGPGLGAGEIWTIALETLMLCLAASVLFLPVENLTRRCGNLLTGALMGRCAVAASASAKSRGRRTAFPPSRAGAHWAGDASSPANGRHWARRG